MIIRKKWIWMAMLWLGSMALAPSLPAQQYWVEVFEDEFDQTDLDQSVWDDDMDRCRDDHPYFYWSPYPGPPNEHEVFEMTGNSIKMYIDEVPTSFDIPCIQPDGSSNFKYILAGMETWQEFKEGYFEVSFKISDHAEMFPAFWLSGDYSGPEIDIFEILTENPKKVTNNVHCNSSILGNFPDNSPYKNAKTYCSNGSNPPCGILAHKLSNQFTKIGLRWTEDRISFIIDGTVVRNIYRPANPSTGDEWRIENLFKYRQNILLNMGGKEYDLDPGETVSFTTPMTNAFLDQFDDIYDNPWVEFQYLRVWKLLDCTEDVNICDYRSNYVTGYDKPSNYVGRVITAGGTGCTVVVQKNPNDSQQKDVMKLLATQKVSLKTGFKVEAGSDFLAKIIPCGGSSDQPDENSTPPYRPMTTPRIQEETDRELERTPDTVEPLAAELKVFPNPSNGIFTVETQGFQSKSMRITLTDLMGKEVFNDTFENVSILDLNFQDQPAGFYLLKVQCDTQEFQRRIVIQ